MGSFSIGESTAVHLPELILFLLCLLRFSLSWPYSFLLYTDFSMKFLLFAAAFAAITLAAPATLGRRAVFATKTYDELSISGGVAGNAQQEALDVLSGLPDDLSTAEKADLDFLNSVNQIANDAETEAFNPAIEGAADEDEADALQVQYISSTVVGHSLGKHMLTSVAMASTARQDQEQGPQTHSNGAQAPGPGSTGPRCGKQVGDGTEEAEQQHCAR